MDLAPTAVAMATKLRAAPSESACGGDACFKQGSAAAIPWPDASFNAIMSTDVLEHVPRSLLGATVSEFTRVSREALFLVIALNKEGEDRPHIGLLHETVQPGSWWREQFERTGHWNCSAPTTHVTSRMHRLSNAWLQCLRSGGVGSGSGSTSSAAVRSQSRGGERTAKARRSTGWLGWIVQNAVTVANMTSQISRRTRLGG